LRHVNFLAGAREEILCGKAISGFINALSDSHVESTMSINDQEIGPLALADIAGTLRPYVENPLSNSQLSSIATYLSLLKKWNQTVPLTSFEDDAEIVAQHFGESIFAGSVVPIEGGRLADVGTGAGFPGIPLKIAFPGLHVTLIEPNAKKCAFLREAQTALGLSDVEVIRSRYEDFNAASAQYDFICSRALGGYRRLLQWSRRVLKAQGYMVLWLGIDDSNLIARTKGWNWNLPEKIPESRRRVILSGKAMP
jgi:16S rRNA (guanine527-N7)-methyltransferase